MSTIVCSVCKSIIPPAAAGSITMGYGLDAERNPVCYGCCARRDMEDMRKTGRAVLYLTIPNPVKIKRGWEIMKGMKISNWPGSLEFRVLNDTAKISQTNWGLTRVDVWFEFDGFIWHGKNIGGDSQLLHCRKTVKHINPEHNKKHYVGGAGLHGYMFNYQTWGYSRGAVAEDLGSLHELSGRAIARLRRDCTLELDLHVHGNEYCEILECDCGDPNLHSDY